MKFYYLPIQNKPNGILKYFIDDSEAANIFTINETTGEISARRSLENLPQSIYTVSVYLLWLINHVNFNIIKKDAKYVL